MAGSIIIIGFNEKYVKGPEGKLVPVDMVTWVPRHSPQSMRNTERVERLNPENLRFRDGEDQQSEKSMHMHTIWAEIEPAYRAWKEGRELPTHGTALAVWPAVTQEQADILRLAGLKTVEDVAEMSDSVRSRINLPDTRELKDLARIYLENSGATAAAEREAEKDRKIEAIEEQNSILSAQIAELQRSLQALGTSQAPPATDADIVALRTQLDARGIAYHHNHGAPKLRELLATQGQAA